MEPGKDNLPPRVDTKADLNIIQIVVTDNLRRVLAGETSIRSAVEETMDGFNQQDSDLNRWSAMARGALNNQTALDFLDQKTKLMTECSKDERTTIAGVSSKMAEESNEWQEKVFGLFDNLKLARSYDEAMEYGRDLIGSFGERKSADAGMAEQIYEDAEMIMRNWTKAANRVYKDFLDLDEFLRNTEPLTEFVKKINLNGTENDKVEELTKYLKSVCEAYGKEMSFDELENVLVRYARSFIPAE